MSKPCFTLSVSREFMYRARIYQTGEIITSDSFHDLYKSTLRHLRAENAGSEYPIFRCAWLEYGYETVYEDLNHELYSEFEIIQRYGMIWNSSVDQGFNRWGDDKECITDKGEYRQ